MPRYRSKRNRQAKTDSKPNTNVEDVGVEGASPEENASVWVEDTTGFGTSKQEEGQGRDAGESNGEKPVHDAETEWKGYEKARQGPSATAKGLGSYLRESAELLRSLNDPEMDDQRASLVDSVLEELGQRAVEVARDQRASRRIEEIAKASIAAGSPALVSRLMETLCPDPISFFHLATDQYAAHVLQTLAGFVRDIPLGEDNSLASNLTAYCCGQNLVSIMSHHCATHVFRALARSVGGLPPLRHSKHSQGYKQQQKKKCKAPTGSPTGGPEECAAPINVRMSCLSKMAQSVVALTASERDSLVCGTYSSPALQVLLESLPEGSAFEELLRSLTMQKGHTEKPPVNSEALNRWMADKFGSHLVQCMLVQSAKKCPALFGEMAVAVFGPLAELVSGGRGPRFGQFCLQTALDNLSDVVQLKKVTAKLNVGSLLKSWAQGACITVVKAAEACFRLNHKKSMTKMAERICSFAGENGGKSPWEVFVEYEGDGCLLLSTLLKFPTSALPASLSEGPSTATGQRLMGSKAGRKLLESVVGSSSPLPYDVKARLIEGVVAQQVAELAVDKYGGGGWLVSACWEGAVGKDQARLRTVLANRLAANQEPVKAKNLALWLRCGMEQFMRDRQEWSELQARQAKAAAIMEDIFEEDTHQQKPKKRRRKTSVAED